MAKSIEVIVGTGGEIRIGAVGFKGIGCEKATEFLETALGTVSAKTRKPEYYAGVRYRQHIGGAQ